MDGLRWSCRNKGSDSTWNDLCFEEGAKKKILLTQKPPPKETSLKWLSDHKRSLSMQFLIGMQFLTMFMAVSPISIM